MTVKPKLHVLLCAPRGFCAGVVRAIDAVEEALRIHGAPVYVRHEIVHNKYVVEGLKAKGAIFVEELDEVPDTAQPVIFSAHGVPKSIPEQAEARKIFAIDATCPLVTKVHREAELHHRQGRQVLLVGHAGHPEVVGTLGQLPPGSIILVQTLDDIAKLQPSDEKNLAYVTQTTLSIDDTRCMVDALNSAVPQHCRTASRGHLLRDDKPAGGGEAHRLGRRRLARRRLREFVQFATIEGSGRALGMQARPPRAARR